MRVLRRIWLKSSEDVRMWDVEEQGLKRPLDTPKRMIERT